MIIQDFSAQRNDRQEKKMSCTEREVLKWKLKNSEK
jgi:hypothetical protein